MQKIDMWLWAKIGSVAFNSISTWNVFKDALTKSNGDFIGFLGGLLAVVLVDVTFIALMDKLEMPYVESENVSHRWSYASGLIILYVCIVAIGVFDEGVIAVAPRIAIGIITYVSVSRYYAEWKDYRDSTWQDRFEKKRYREERRDQQWLGNQQRKIKNKQRIFSLKKLVPELQQDYYLGFREQLLTHTKKEPEKSHTPIPKPVVYKQVELKRDLMVIDNPKRSEIPPGVICLDEKHWQWQCPECELSNVVPTLWGAKIGMSRHANSHARNGHNTPSD
jgi:hypothetical protein